MKKVFLLVSLALVLGLVMGCPDPVTPTPEPDPPFMPMVPITGGEFARDNDGTGSGTDTTAITVSDFYLGETEVTQAQWAAVMTDNQSPSHFDTDVNLPVESISWYDAIEFCNALSAAEGLTEFYTVSGENVTVADWKADGYRLPTEAEWEYAAGGGESSARTIYAAPITVDSGLDGIDDAEDTKKLIDYAWYTENSGSTTHAVKGKKPNDLGLYDMSGNVWEWCWDWYVNPYDTSVKDDPTGAASGPDRVLRGGGWHNILSSLHVANRSNGGLPSYRNSALGLRVARSVSP